MASHDESVQEIQEKDESLIKSVSAFFSEVSAYLETQQREITNNIQLIVEA